MSNAPFQKVTNIYPALGIQGQIASQNPAVFMLGNPPAASAGVTVGQFVWLNGSGEVENVGTDPALPVGIVLATLAYANPNLQAAYSMEVTGGHTTTVLTKGDIFAVISTASTVGQTIFAKLSDGTMTSGTAGTPVAGHVETDFKVVTAGAAGTICTITNWS